MQISGKLVGVAKTTKLLFFKFDICAMNRWNK